MAELTISLDETPGIMKEIDGGAFELMFQAIQEDIYSYPIKSFVREAISNGLDALVEKQNYIAIKNGAPVEKYYRQLQDGKLLKDSEFEPEYYTDKYLHKINKVFVKYTKPSGTRKHKITITDTGVGLGRDRLQGFFKIGYSTKRNLKNVFGKWGSGAKAGLATGEDYFIMTTVYNGYKTSFMIFKTDYEGITPSHPQGKKESWKVRSINGDEVTRVIYWHPTKELNSVTITLEVKPHNETRFRSAVENQFEHFDGLVEFSYPDEQNKLVINELNVKPLFESDTILIPNNPSYVSPVVLVDKISYGPIAWEELELERRPGAISLKVHATDVDITQSRESLKWTEKTKKVILRAIKKAEEEATDHISKKMELEDKHNLFDLIKRYSEIASYSSSDLISRSFTKFLNLRTLNPNYVFHPAWLGRELTVKVTSSLFDVLFYGYTVKNVTIDMHAGVVKTKSRKIDSFEDMADMPIVYSAKAPLGPKLANHLLRYELEADSFIYIRSKPTEGKAEQKIGKITLETSVIDKYTRHLLENYGDIDLDEYEYEEIIEEVDDIGESIDGVEVEVDSRTLAEIRKQNEEVLYRYRRSFNYSMDSETIKRSTVKDAIKKHEGTVVLCTAEYKEYGRFLEKMSYEQNVESNKVTVLYVSKEVLQDFKSYAIFITDYFRQYDKESGELKIGDALYQYNTRAKIDKLTKKYSSEFFEEDLMRRFDSYFKDNWYDGTPSLDYVNSDEKNKIKSFIANLNTVENLLDKKELTPEVCKKLFNVDKISILNSYDKEYIQHVEDLMVDFTKIEPLLRLQWDTDIQSDQVRILKQFINNNTLNQLENVSI